MNSKYFWSMTYDIPNRLWISARQLKPRKRSCQIMYMYLSICICVYILRIWKNSPSRHVVPITWISLKKISKWGVSFHFAFQTRLGTHRGGPRQAAYWAWQELGVCILRNDMARENTLGFAQKFAQSPNLGCATGLLRGRFVSVRLEWHRENMSGSRNDPAKPLEFQIKFNLGFMCFVLPATSSTSENEIPPYIYIYIYMYIYMYIYVYIYTILMIGLHFSHRLL